MTASPKAQAEAMARGVFNDALRIFGNENISEDAAFIKAISTALEKLLTENERLKNLAHICDRHQYPYGVDPSGETTPPICCWCEQKEAERLQSQLTATEAKLEEAKLLFQRLISEEEGFPAWGDEVPKEWEQWCRAFLSTLTAAKKEEAK